MNILYMIIEVWMKFPMTILVDVIWIYLIYDFINRSRSSETYTANGAHVFYLSNLLAVSEIAFDFHYTFYYPVWLAIFSFADDCV